MRILNPKGSLRHSFSLIDSCLSSPAVAVLKFIGISDALSVDTTIYVLHLNCLLVIQFLIAILSNHPVSSTRIELHDLTSDFRVRGNYSHCSTLKLQGVRNWECCGKLLPNVIKLAFLNDFSCRLTLMESVIGQHVRFSLWILGWHVLE